MDFAFRLEHSVDVDVSLPFAWAWRTAIENWNDPPARFQLDGPFLSGTFGTTVLPGQDPARWRIREVHPPASFIIDMPLDGAVLSFEWLFHAVSNQRTLMTQRLVLSGVKAAAYVEQVRAGFATSLADGMQRLADDMARAARSATIGDREA